MRVMRWWKQQTNKTHGDNEKHGRRLERRSRGVTTLHHYKRISSHDLGWHRRRTEGEEVKWSCFFDKRVKPRTLRGWTTWKKEYNGDKQYCKHSVGKEEQGTSRERCRLKDKNGKINERELLRNHSGLNENREGMRAKRIQPALR